MNFTQLENLDAVLEYGGVRRAAAHLGVTPQAVSSSIRKLERELGCALFERVGIELRPTGFCLRFANQAKSVLIAERALREMAKKCPGGFSAERHFRLYVPGLNGRGDLFDDEMYDRFSSKNPTVHLDVWAQSSNSCEDALMLDLADAAVTFERDKNVNTDYREVGSAPLVVLCSGDNQDLTAGPVRPDQLFGHHIAMPVNLSVCLRSFLRKNSFDITSLALRNTGYGVDDQLEFIQRGGLVLALQNAPLAKERDVQIVRFERLQEPRVPLFFCNKRGEWTELHQAMYWFLIEAFQEIMR